MRGVCPGKVQVCSTSYSRSWSVRTVGLVEIRPFDLHQQHVHLTCRKHSCERLGKICQPAKSKRQLKADGARNSRVEKARSDDVSRLERKLDQLVAHLKGPQHNLASPSSSDASQGFLSSAIRVSPSVASIIRCTLVRGMNFVDWTACLTLV